MEELRLQGEKLTPQHLFLKDKQGWTPLHEAATAGHLDQVALLFKASGETFSLQHLIHPFIQGDGGNWTLLHAAAWNGHLDQVGEILNASGEKLSAEHLLMKGQGGWTPLSSAAKYNHLDQIFVPALWRGRLGEMIKLWEKVPPENQEGHDFKKIIEEALLLSVASAPKVEATNFSQATRAAAPAPLEASPTKTRSFLSRFWPNTTERSQ
jgi:hypothetical protein